MRRFVDGPVGLIYTPAWNLDGSRLSITRLHGLMPSRATRLSEAVALPIAPSLYLLPARTPFIILVCNTAGSCSY